MDWTSEEDCKLLELLDTGITDREIGKQIGRSKNSVRSRRVRLSKAPTTAKPRFTNQRTNLKSPRTFLRAAVFDLETTSFDTSGWDGHLICCSILPLDEAEPVCHAIRFEEQRDDKRLLQSVIEELDKFDIVIGHNIRAFDLNWLQSRAVYHRLPQLPAWLCYDTYQVAKTMALKVTKGLGSLGSYFGLGGVKTSIFKTDWSKINSPHRDEFDTCLSQIVYHCNEDVKLNRDLFDVLWSYDPQRKLPKTKW